jgi:hypothetical protein
MMLVEYENTILQFQKCVFNAKENRVSNFALHVTCTKRVCLTFSVSS